MSDGIKRVFKTPLTVSGDTQINDALGDIRIEGGKIYKYVKFSGTNAVAAGDVCCYVLSDTNFQTVDKANSAVGAGVACAAHASGVVEYGWIQVRGLVTINGAVPAQGSPCTITGASAGLVVIRGALTNQDVGTLVDATNKVLFAQFPH